MKLTILVDNNTFIDQYYHGEPAASFYIEADGEKILFDTGYSDILLSNAEKMGIDLNSVSHIVLSHGHDDHTRGLQFLKDTIDCSNKKLIAHPECFHPKYGKGLYIGSPFSEEEIGEILDYVPCKEVYQITENLIFLGQIPRTNDYENQRPIGQCMRNGVLEGDYLLDDTALVYKSSDGLCVITGCSHSGICNIIEYAKTVCNENKIHSIIGGFHLFSDNEQLQKTIDYFRKQRIEKLYPCHCVSQLARFKMMEKLPVIETGVGLTVEFK